MSERFTTIRVHCAVSQKITDFWCYMLVSCFTLAGESCITHRVVDWVAPPLDLNHTL